MRFYIDRVRSRPLRDRDIEEYEYDICDSMRSDDLGVIATAYELHHAEVIRDLLNRHKRDMS